MGEDNICYRP
ncbi:hypothetical protein Nmel_002846 [Mimus melanotis]